MLSVARLTGYSARSAVQGVFASPCCPDAAVESPIFAPCRHNETSGLFKGCLGEARASREVKTVAICPRREDQARIEGYAVNTSPARKPLTSPEPGGPCSSPKGSMLTLQSSAPAF